MENHAENIAGRGAERHANADFLHAARDRIGNDSVNTQKRQREADASKNGEQHAAEPLVADGFGDGARHRG